MSPRTILASTAALALAGVFVAAPASAVDLNPCDVAGWFVNPDEADREPVRTTAGFVFEGADLIHHAAPAGLTTKTLSSGDFTASPAPDQPSFFSVEVSGDDGGYATLRYNRLTHLWNMVTAGQFYEHADPDKLVDLPTVKRSHTVVRFGVGYTKSRPGSVKTTVTAVSFQGKAYSFTCTLPSQSPSASVTPSATTSPSTSISPRVSVSPSASPKTTSPSASPSRSRTSTPSASPSDAVVFPSGSGYAGDDELPTTGASLPLIVAGSAGLLLAGGFALYLTRRRRPRH